MLIFMYNTRCPEAAGYPVLFLQIRNNDFKVQKFIFVL